MKYRVEIVHKATGEKRLSREFGGELEPGDFLWTEGNFSCDCNRGDFFAQAANEPEVDYPCGNDFFWVSKAILEDGTEVLLDDSPVESF